MTRPTTPPGARPTPPSPGPDLAELVADAVRTCSSVDDLHGGPFGAVATYAPGRRVVGVRLPEDPTLRGGVVEVHVTGRYPAPLTAIAAQVRAAVAVVVPGAAVAVTVEDVVAPPGHPDRPRTTHQPL